jgi:hypothetical protein
LQPVYKETIFISGLNLVTFFTGFGGYLSYSGNPLSASYPQGLTLGEMSSWGIDEIPKITLSTSGGNVSPSGGKIKQAGDLLSPRGDVLKIAFLSYPSRENYNPAKGMS